MAELVLTEQNFEEEVLQSKVPVLVDFWAVWCGPCKMIAPVISQISEEYAGKVKVGTVNVDQEPGLLGQFEVAGVPTLLFFIDGKLVKRHTGYCTREETKEMLKDNFGIS